MTFEEWKEEPDNFFEWLSCSEIWEFPQWKIWENKLDLTLRFVDPILARNISMNKLIEVAGLKNEIELAKKQAKVQKKIDEIKEDF